MICGCAGRCASKIALGAMSRKTKLLGIQMLQIVYLIDLRCERRRPIDLSPGLGGAAYSDQLALISIMWEELEAPRRVSKENERAMSKYTRQQLGLDDEEVELYARANVSAIPDGHFTPQESSEADWLSSGFWYGLAD
jgi:hypothetical protein